MWDVSRGVAFYEGKVYSATIDGRLIALDAETGEELWSVLTIDPQLPLFITGAFTLITPRIQVSVNRLRSDIDAVRARRPFAVLGERSEIEDEDHGRNGNAGIARPGGKPRFEGLNRSVAAV